jgi:TatD DNase family protein
MALADEVGLPVVIHEREAHADGLKIVKKWADKVPGVFHCFSGSAEMAKEIIAMGWYVSFTGVVTFKNARRALEAVAAVPMDRIMIETDSPYMAPTPYRGKRNHSGYVPKVAEKIAEIKGLTTEEVAAITMENGERFFRIPK